MQDIAIHCRDNAGHHNAIPLLDQIEQDMAVPLRNIASLYLCATRSDDTLPTRSYRIPNGAIPTLDHTSYHYTTRYPCSTKHDLTMPLVYCAEPYKALPYHCKTSDNWAIPSLRITLHSGAIPCHRQTNHC